ncbi:hypothetical protein [Novosphingobium olei]|uniref:Uncharacterized protein n=1 Tax=Novosphingobium olei TaxID=2728851 RepID=A0A7Y0BMX5_9SPHN|nr:hypothetical protein [Novosphingobium olei]NML93228.1 hypothetical protein [Novosphingobium olei]
MAKAALRSVPTAATFAAAAALRSPAASTLHARRQGGLDLAFVRHATELWLVLRRQDRGGVALRLPLFAEPDECTVEETTRGIEIACNSVAGTVRIAFEGDDFDLEQLRITLRIRPAQDIALRDLPRDLVPLDAQDDPTGASGRIEAEQRRLNTGLIYFEFDRPAFGKVLYIQNLSALNDYFNLTGSKPENAVGGEWPDLGYRPPVDHETGAALLVAGREITLYDTILVIRRYAENDEADSAWQFLDMLGAAYRWLGAPVPAWRDWVDRSQRTLADLETAPEARIEHYGLSYFHPYTASEYPDVMVQLSLLSALRDWEVWSDEPQPLSAQILAGIERFYDAELGTIRRYLPNVGNDKDADAVDSWYLYHPLLNLSNVALAGNEQARDLFLPSIDYGIRAAQHFAYRWPILYNARDFSVIRAVAESDQRGQTDVGGIYAWVMLQAFELTREKRFLDEAVLAIEAAKGMRFDLNYQANLTAWGATACIRLWRITGDKSYLTQSYVYLASFFHNAQLWESEIALARHYTNFLGVTCLQDAPYMAAYECFDSFSAFERYLDLGGPDLITSVRLLVGEYCRHALSRAWFYYPDALPAHAISDDPRNGYIQRGLNFPFEDLYPDGQQAGQVGQEIYGAGAALVYATRAFHRIEGAPFVLFCDHFVRAWKRFDETTVSFRLDGQDGCTARIFLRFEGDAPDSSRVGLRGFDGRDIAFRADGALLCAEVSAAGSFLLKYPDTRSAHGGGATQVKGSGLSARQG